MALNLRKPKRWKMHTYIPHALALITDIEGGMKCNGCDYKFQVYDPFDPQNGLCEGCFADAVKERKQAQGRHYDR